MELAIRKNDGQNGPWYSVSATRSYTQGEEWEQSDGFGPDDRLVLAKLLDMADSWIWTQQQQARQQDRQRPLAYSAVQCSAIPVPRLSGRHSRPYVPDCVLPFSQSVARGQVESEAFDGIGPNP